MTVRDVGRPSANVQHRDKQDLIWEGAALTAFLNEISATTRSGTMLGFVSALSEKTC
jgi:hypothetical protein